MKVRFGLTYRGQADLALDDFPQAVPPTDWTAELETLAADILERQT